MYAEEVETIEEKIDRIAIAHNIATTTLYNLAKSESQLGTQRIGDDGKSCGVVHFHQDYYPEENSRCDDDEYILTRASEMISQGEEWKFTPCNCYAFATVLVGRLPKMLDILPNSNYPRVGGLVVLRYKNDKHIGVVQSVEKDGVWIREANFEPCKLGSRLISWDDPALKGFVSYDD